MNVPHGTPANPRGMRSVDAKFFLYAIAVLQHKTGGYSFTP